MVGWDAGTYVQGLSLSTRTGILVAHVMPPLAVVSWLELQKNYEYGPSGSWNWRDSRNGGHEAENLLLCHARMMMYDLCHHHVLCRPCLDWEWLVREELDFSKPSPTRGDLGQEVRTKSSSSAASVRDRLSSLKQSCRFVRRNLSTGRPSKVCCCDLSGLFQ